METIQNLWRQTQENLLFVVVCVLIATSLIVGTHLIEKWLPQKRKTTSAQRSSIIGICSAVAAVLHIFDFALPFLAPDFYKLDFSEIPVLLCGYYLGPSSAVACEGVKIVLKLLLKGTSTAFVGDFANFAVGCSFVIPATIVYHLHKTRKTAVIGMAVGTGSMAIFGSAFNAFYLLPKFAQLYKLPLDKIVAMGHAVNASVNSVESLVLLCVVPLNLLKGTVVSLITFFVYKRIETFLFKKNPV